MQDVNGKLFSETPVRFVLLVWSLKEMRFVVDLHTK